jgi:hypothetical protein
VIPYGQDYPDPLAEPGHDVLDDVHEFVARFVAFPSDHAAVAVALWAAHSHLVDTFESTPRLALLSPEKQCGKTRVLEVLELICAGSERLSDASPAYLFRRIGAGVVTVLLDEADAIWKRGKADESAEALRSIVNAGHRKGSFVGRAHPNGNSVQLQQFPVYAPVALAGIGNCLPDTVLDRSVIVQMRRRAPGEQVAEFRYRTARPEGEELRARLATSADSVVKRVGDPWPVMPTGVVDRPADVWEPLITVGDLAGGDWPALARAACLAFVKGSRDDSISVGVRLLQDLRGVFGNADAMWTEVILGKLHGISEAPWADWYGKPLDARQLAKLLKPYGIGSHLIRIGDDVARDTDGSTWRTRGPDTASPRHPTRGDAVTTTTVDVTSVTSVTRLASPVTLVTPVTHNPDDAR